jgi:hypothetical protein
VNPTGGRTSQPLCIECPKKNVFQFAIPLSVCPGLVIKCGDRVSQQLINAEPLVAVEITCIKAMRFETMLGASISCRFSIARTWIVSVRWL